MSRRRGSATALKASEVAEARAMGGTIHTHMGICQAVFLGPLPALSMPGNATIPAGGSLLLRHVTRLFIAPGSRESREANRRDPGAMKRSDYEFPSQVHFHQAALRRRTKRGGQPEGEARTRCRPLVLHPPRNYLRPAVRRFRHRGAGSGCR